MQPYPAMAGQHPGEMFDDAYRFALSEPHLEYRLSPAPFFQWPTRRNADRSC